jgi:hypothetical protein
MEIGRFPFGSAADLNGGGLRYAPFSLQLRPADLIDP